VTDCIDKQPQWLIQNIPPEKGDRVRKFAILLVALSPLVLASSGSGVTVQIPDEVTVAGVKVETEDGRITAK
jgi:hypothetical protein